MTDSTPEVLPTVKTLDLKQVFIVPCADRVTFERVYAPIHREDGLVLPDSVRETYPLVGLVLLVGPDVTRCKAGDTVLIGSASAQAFDTAEGTVGMVPEAAVVGILVSHATGLDDDLPFREEVPESFTAAATKSASRLLAPGQA